MVSNGNQYFPQGLQYIPDPYGANPYGINSGFGQEFGYPGFGQQVPAHGPFAAFGSSQGPNQNIGPQLITTLSQLANQVVAQGATAQQVGVLLGQLVQQIVAQTSYGNSALVPGALQGNPFAGVAGNPALAGQGFGGQGIGTAFGQSPYGQFPYGQSPYAGGFAPQVQAPQNQAWAINRPAVLQ